MLELTETGRLAEVAAAARSLFAERLQRGAAGPPWWTTVVVTAGSPRQAERFRAEIDRRSAAAQLPAGVAYLVSPDPEDARSGSGGATLRVLAGLPGGQGSAAWWAGQRVLLIHAGGDARRLPQSALTGRLFSPLPLATASGEASTLFDELLALSSGWAARMPAGVLAASGDVLAVFDPASVAWDAAGATGVALRQSARLAASHGVYAAGERGRVYSYMQKPSLEEVQAAGGLLEDGRVALDVGLLLLDPQLASRLAALELPAAPLDLYWHFTRGFTGQWQPGLEEHPALHQLAEVLRQTPFTCALTEGEFTHLGNTRLFRGLMTGEGEFARLYAAQRRLGALQQPGLRCAGVVIDSVMAGGEVEAGALVLECSLEEPVRVGRGAVLQGLEWAPPGIAVPEDTVLHYVPIRQAGGVLRVYGVEDDPRQCGPQATWFGQPLEGACAALGLAPEEVWPDTEPASRSLWNAELWPCGTAEQTWQAALWMLRLPASFDAGQWRASRRLSLEASERHPDDAALAAARGRRRQAQWRQAARQLAAAGADLRPLLVHAPGLAELQAAGRPIAGDAAALEDASQTEAAARHWQASLFFAQAGLTESAAEARRRAFGLVEAAVRSGCAGPQERWRGPWRATEARVVAPARVDFGGGWSDTPPFCIDWGGAVLNAAILIDGAHPIETRLRVIPELEIRCRSSQDPRGRVFRTTRCALGAPAPGDPYAIVHAALAVSGLLPEDQPLEGTLERLGGGLEITLAVNLPMGSGLGASSILSATLLEALARCCGQPLEPQRLCDLVLRLEQHLGSGGGWQDQAGAIFPGVKLVSSGPGSQQRVRVQPVAWPADLADRLVLYDTGVQRIARGLLQQVVGSYLARETATVQVLHSIKTLASEMSFALAEGDWPHLGGLLDRHWRLNQQLDPNTINAPIAALLESARPHIFGAKLAGAGGGGFLMLLARDPAAAAALRARLAQEPGGRVCGWAVAPGALETPPTAMG